MNSPTTKQILMVIWLIATAGILLLLLFQSVPADRDVAIRTLLLGIGAASISIPMGGLLAWVSLGRGLICRCVLLTTIALLVVPVFLHVSTWDSAFGKLGWLTSQEGQVLVPLVSGWSAAIWIHGVAAAPQVAILILLGISTGRRVFEEQALLDTGTVGVFWNVTVKRVWPLLVLGALWTMIVCAREIAATDLYQIGTLAEQVYLGYSLGQFTTLQGNWTQDQLSAIGDLNGLVATLVIFWLAISACYLFVRMSDFEWESGHWQPLQRSDSSCSKNMVGAALLIVTVVAPIGNLVVRCCYFVSPVDGVPTAGYSLEQGLETLRRACFDYTSEFTWSVLIASASASTILILASVMTWKARRSRVWQTIFVGSLAISCAIPGPMMGTWIASALGGIDIQLANWLYDRTILAPVMANAWYCWPLAPLVIWFVFRKIANDGLENSQLEGAGKWTRFFRFGVIENGLALTGCWLISFAFCFGELSASQIVLPPGIDTIPRLMLGLLHAGVDEMTAGLTIITFGSILLVSMIGWFLIQLNQPVVRRQ